MLENVRLVEFEFGGAVSTPKAGGEVWCLGELQFFTATTAPSP